MTDSMYLKRHDEWLEPDIRVVTPIKLHSEEAVSRHRYIACAGKSEFSVDFISLDKNESRWMRSYLTGGWQLVKRNDVPWIECVPRESPPCRMCIPMYECESSPCEWRMIGNSMQIRGTGDTDD